MTTPGPQQGADGPNSPHSDRGRAGGLSYGSVCSGIEAASVAWGLLGWRAAWFAEIEPFPCAVLAHRFPAVPNLGDMTAIAERIERGEVEAPDILVGGTPCQAFSIAGKRGSLADERGNLSLAFVRLADAIDRRRGALGLRPCIVVWENVPGVLSVADNAFGCFLAGLAGESQELEPPGGRWTDAGCVFGPSRAACWRILDAQWFNLAQRRERVFVVASAGAIDPGQVLLEWEGVRRDSAPSRESRQGAAANAGRGAAFGGGNQSGPIEVATACNAHGVRLDFDSETLVAHETGQGWWKQDDVAGTLRAEGENRPSRPSHVVGVTHSLRADGVDASEDGTGRGTPIVPVPMVNMQGSKGNAVAQEDGPSYTLNAMHGHDVHAVAVPVAIPLNMQAAAKTGAKTPNMLGVGDDGDPSPTLGANDRHAVAVGSHWDNPANAHPSLSQSHNTGGIGGSNQELFSQRGANIVPVAFSHQAGGVQTTLGFDPASGTTPTLNGSQTAAVAFQQNTRDEVRLIGGDGQIAGALASEAGMKQQNYVAVPYDLFQITAPVNRQNRKDGDPCHTLARDNAAHAAVVQPIAWDEELNASVGVSGPVIRGGDGGRHAGVAFPIDTQNMSETSSVETAVAAGYDPGYGDAEKARSVEALRLLLRSVDEKEGARWGLGILASLWPEAVLRARMHGTGIRCDGFSFNGLVNLSPSRQEDRSTGIMLRLWEAGCAGCPPQGWGLHEQRAGELAAHLSELPYAPAPFQRLMHDLWEAAEGLGVLRSALSAVQEAWRSACDQGKPIHADGQDAGANQGAMQVRRLCVMETEALQGFPRGWTLVPHRGKPAADGPRYKAIGNSMAVPIVRWIGKRIAGAL